MDEFERKLSVGLKTAVRDLPAAPRAAATANAVRVDETASARRPRRPRIALVTAVLLAIALVVGGSWWALGRGTSTTPLGDAVCTDSDLTVTHEPTPAADASLAAVIAVRAGRACTLAAPPKLVVDGATTVEWDASPQDTTDRHPWSAVPLAPGDVARFAVRTYALAVPVSCPPAPPRDLGVEVVLAGQERASLSFDVPSTGCSTLGFTTYGVLPGQQPCTADDLGLSVATSAGGNADVLADVAVQARSACALTVPPTLTLNGNDVPWRSDDGSAWSVTNLAAGATVSFALSGTAGGFGSGCEGVIGFEVAVHAGSSPAASTSFDLGQSVCGPVTFTTSVPPVESAQPGTEPCTAADLRVTRADIGHVTAGVGVGIVATAPCELDQPPTVVVSGGGLDPVTARFAGLQPQDQTPWMPELLDAGDTARFSLAFAAVAHSCAYSPPRQVEVSVRIGSDTSARFPWTLSTPCALEGLVLVIGP